MRVCVNARVYIHMRFVCRVSCVCVRVNLVSASIVFLFSTHTGGKALPSRAYPVMTVSCTEENTALANLRRRPFAKFFALHITSNHE